MSTLQYIPTQKLNKRHVAKPMKLQLKNGKHIYGAIKEIRRDGIVFIPVKNPSATTQAHTSILPILIPIFIPFVFFVPFLII